MPSEAVRTPADPGALPAVLAHIAAVCRINPYDRGTVDVQPGEPGRCVITACLDSRELVMMSRQSAAIVRRGPGTANCRGRERMAMTRRRQPRRPRPLPGLTVRPRTCVHQAPDIPLQTVAGSTIALRAISA